MNTTTNKMNLKGLSKTELQAYITSIHEKPFRAQQIYQWLYGKGAGSFAEMTNLSKSLRDALAGETKIENLRLKMKQESSKDKSIKFLFELDDGLLVESVLMFESQRATLCVSTQVGCAIDCKFCATGMMGLKRNLSAGEILDQLLQVQKHTTIKISNLVCMGMGEPFHNYENLIKACQIISDEEGPNLSKRHIVVSTSGLIPQIYRFADENHDFKLAVSLNATTDEVRSQIMPITRKWPIRELMESVEYYLAKKKRPVTFEYVLLDGINDSDSDAERLRRLVHGLLCKINLIPFNPILGNYKRSPTARIMKFYEKLADMRAPVTIRWSKGDDIDAGCGQLATKAS